MNPKLRAYLAALGSYIGSAMKPYQALQMPFKHKGNHGETKETQLRLMHDAAARRECRRLRRQGMAWSPVDKAREAKA